MEKIRRRGKHILEAVPARVRLSFLPFAGGKQHYMKKATKILVILAFFALLDMVIPIPFAALLLIYVVLEKPEWFKKLVAEIYSS